MSKTSLHVKFEALSRREKVMTLVSGIALVLLTGFTFFIEPAMNDLSEYRKELATEEMRKQTLQAQQALFVEALSVDPDAEKHAEYDELVAKKNDLSVSFSTQLDELVSPDEMVLLVEEVFSHTHALTLTEMSSAEPVSVFADNESMQDVELYQHGVTMTFRGNYFDVKNFIEVLETRSRQLYWRSIDYEVTAWPAADVTVEVYTLSTDKAFIGV